MTIEERLKMLEAAVRVLAIEDYVDDSEVCLRHNGKAEVVTRCRVCQAESCGDIKHEAGCPVSTAAQNVLYCAICLKPQFSTPNGSNCKNGHVGALGYTRTGKQDDS